MNKILLNTGKILLGLLAILISVFILAVLIAFFVMWYQTYTTDREDKGFYRIYKSFKNSAYLTFVGSYWILAVIYTIITEGIKPNYN